MKLDVARLAKQVVIEPKLCSVGELTWTSSRGERILALRYWLEPKTEDRAVLRITSRLEADGTETSLVEPILLASTIPNFGGVRWWFICPLIVKEVACNRRARKLYLPPGARYFGCRICYSLTYESAQTHDARVGKLMKNPWALVEAFEGKDANQTILAFRAYMKLHGWG